MSDCTHVAAPCPPPRAGRPTPAPPRPTPGCWPRPWRWAGGCRCPASWASSRPPAGPASPPPSQPASTPPSSSQVHNQLLMILQNLSNMFPNPDIIHIEASTINYSISKSSATLLDCVLRASCYVPCWMQLRCAAAAPRRAHQIFASHPRNMRTVRCSPVCV